MHGEPSARANFLNKILTVVTSGKGESCALYPDNEAF